ncbi:MAG: DUF4350 domain-containing protein [Armatimonadota bacterium]
MSERARLATFIAATLLLFAGVSLVIRLVTAFDDTRDHASVRTNPWGTRAWRELLEVSGVATETWRLPLSDLSDEVTYLVILDPIESIGTDETEALADWVSAGGRLVIAPFSYRGASADGRIASASLQRTLARFGVRPVLGGEARAHARPTAIDPLTADLSSVLVPTDGRLEIIDGYADVQSEGAPTVLLSDDEDLPVAVTVRHGKGQVMALSEAEILANATLRQADNVILAANLVFAGGAPDTVHFDEYHHGLAGGDGVFTGPEVDVAAFRNTALAALAVALIYALGRSRRFGSPVDGGERRRRSSADYVRALAQVYSRAGAASAAASMLAAGLRRKAASAAVMPSTATPRSLAGGLNARGLPGDEVADLLERLEQADESMNDAQLLALAQRVAHYERML